jgi:hypothetical protein
MNVTAAHRTNMLHEQSHLPHARAVAKRLQANNKPIAGRFG